MPKQPWQTAQTQIRLLLKKQSDQGLPCLLFRQAFCNFQPSQQIFYLQTFKILEHLPHILTMCTVPPCLIILDGDIVIVFCSGIVEFAALLFITGIDAVAGAIFSGDLPVTGIIVIFVGVFAGDAESLLMGTRVGEFTTCAILIPFVGERIPCCDIVMVFVGVRGLCDWGKMLTPGTSWDTETVCPLVGPTGMTWGWLVDGSLVIITLFTIGLGALALIGLLSTFSPPLRLFSTWFPDWLTALLGTNDISLETEGIWDLVVNIALWVDNIPPDDGTDTSTFCLPTLSRLLRAAWRLSILFIFVFNNSVGKAPSTESVELSLPTRSE